MHCDRIWNGNGEEHHSKARSLTFPASRAPSTGVQKYIANVIGDKDVANPHCYKCGRSGLK